MQLIQAENLTKVYRQKIKQPGLKNAVKSLFHSEWTDKLALDSLSFSMAEGESLACIGENGAGKSTLIKMLVGILTPTSGSVQVYGDNPMRHHEAYLRKIGVIFGQKTNLWVDIPVIESYKAVQTLYKLDPKIYEKNMRMVTELLDLEPILNFPARRLSLGQRMKADIGMIFLHGPKILYLDEPTIGLDINVKFTIRKFLRKMNQEHGVSILLTSHDLDDIEQISDNALVISKGKKFYHGSLEGLKSNYATTRLITVKGDARDASDIPEDVLVENEGITTKLTFDIRNHTSAEMLERVSRSFDVRDITIEEPGIDHVVSRIFTEGAQS
ncbi:MAG: ATP-binding cassette domain-containing protein [Defluviitaleaceae bacterium]|nr:ATP-binding cassette domain-containing protein [Defluviitaleaceae bacterium]